MILTLQRQSLDFVNGCLRFGKVERLSETGIVVSLSACAKPTFRFWASQLPNRKPGHIELPEEKYGAKGDTFEVASYATQPTVPIKEIEEAWVDAKFRAAEILKGVPEATENKVVPQERVDRQ